MNSKLTAKMQRAQRNAKKIFPDASSHTLEMNSSLHENQISSLIIGAAIEVHRIKGPGLIEEIYSKCLGRECELRNIPFVRELHVFLEYKGLVFEQPLRLDILIDDVLIVELKAVEVSFRIRTLIIGWFCFSRIL